MDKKTFINLVRVWDAAGVAQALKAKPEYATMADANGMTPLHHLAKQHLAKSAKNAADSIATAKLLLKAGADLNHIRIILDEGEEFKATALWYAVAWGRNPELARFLLKSGADPNHCLFASAWAGDAKLTDLLLQYGAAVDPVAFGETPLLFILKSRRNGAAKALLKHGADINYQDPQGYTVLHHAVKKRFKLKEIQALLDLGADPSIKDRAGETPAQLATRLNHPGVAKLLASAS